MEHQRFVIRVRKYLLFVAIASGLIGACEPADKDVRAKAAPLIPPPSSFIVIDQDMTVSGLGAGAFMASQLHLAFSDRISGLGVIGGGLYFCAQGDPARANEVCRTGGRLELSNLTHEARDQAAAGQLATLNHLQGMRLWAFHGSEDAVFAPEITYGVVEFYEDLAASLKIRYIDDIAAGHGMPTEFEGHQCGRTESPFLNACDYDGAGEMLRFLLQRDPQVSDRAAGELRTIDDPNKAGDVAAYLYQPASCPAGHCRLHVAFHDCEQSAQQVGERFARDAGYNRWADALGLFVLYPQAGSADGCWDWQGTTGDGYATRQGSEIRQIAALLAQLTGTEFP